MSFQVEQETLEPIHPSGSMVGLDAGIAKLATLSDGTVFEPVNSFKNQSDQAGKAPTPVEQKKVKFSSNWKKQKKPRSSGCTHISPIPAAITFTRSQRLSAKKPRDDRH
ncbi:transposase [Aeromonas media]|uniref:transposase n=1 Tax=Aeromonas media TaxID=651 RepID=UPI00384AE398